MDFYYIGSAEGHEYPNLQVGDEVNPRPFFALTHIDQPLLLLYVFSSHLLFKI